MFEGPVTEKKKWVMKKNKKKRNKKIWGSDGEDRVDSPVTPETSGTAPYPKSLTPKLRATVWALRVGDSLSPQSCLQ